MATKAGSITLDSGQVLATIVLLSTFVQFKREAGWDFLKEPDKVDSEALAMLAWCAVRVAARKRGETFDMSFDDFCDNLAPEAVTEWYHASADADGETAPVEKKTS